MGCTKRDKGQAFRSGPQKEEETYNSRPDPFDAEGVVLSNQKLIEIQVRTALQHTWAELSEKFSDVVDPAIKYGGGHEAIRALLAGTSELVAVIESSEQQLSRFYKVLAKQFLLSNSLIWL